MIEICAHSRHFAAQRVNLHITVAKCLANKPQVLTRGLLQMHVHETPRHLFGTTMYTERTWHLILGANILQVLLE